MELWELPGRIRCYATRYLREIILGRGGIELVGVRVRGNELSGGSSRIERSNAGSRARRRLRRELLRLVLLLHGLGQLSTARRDREDKVTGQSHGQQEENHGILRASLGHTFADNFRGK
ncbi:uncharacterized protein LOC112346024 [Selaginella moellendorffii]|uniref:uncharacterized protein LOC112346024 n=1 Tax=Selaginella moellendorffii TaxID=88036 RepID=UPI000D1CAE99|nr:uncharacterized protein LOC112346024 [Selaginella moellendorffii]|eukprot:XP_024529712.1 uncharacterized protein LOC112346024 [Selaginella moellendorffii]